MLPGVERGARRWGRLGAVELAGVRAGVRCWAQELGHRAECACRCKRKVRQGWCGAGLCRRGIVAAEQRRRNTGDGVLATRVAYTPLQRA